jgi:hypothetical protein
LDKYKNRKFVRQLSDANAVMREAIETLDAEKLLSAIVCGSEVNSPSADNCALSQLTESSESMTLPLVELLVQNGWVLFVLDDRLVDRPGDFSAGAMRVSQILSGCVERDHVDQLRLVLRAKAVGNADRQSALDISTKLARVECAKMVIDLHSTDSSCDHACV